MAWEIFVEGIIKVLKDPASLLVLFTVLYADYDTLLD